MEHGASTCLAFSESFALCSRTAWGGAHRIPNIVIWWCHLQARRASFIALHTGGALDHGLNLPGRYWLNVAVYLIEPVTISQRPALMTSTNLQKLHHQILLRYAFEDFSTPKIFLEHVQIRVYLSNGSWRWLHLLIASHPWYQRKLRNKEQWPQSNMILWK